VAEYTVIIEIGFSSGVISQLQYLYIGQKKRTKNNFPQKSCGFRTRYSNAYLIRNYTQYTQPKLLAIFFFGATAPILSLGLPPWNSPFHYILDIQ
jgi:hypothetical protein